MQSTGNPNFDLDRSSPDRGLLPMPRRSCLSQMGRAGPNPTIHRLHLHRIVADRHPKQGLGHGVCLPLSVVGVPLQDSHRMAPLMGQEPDHPRYRLPAQFWGHHDPKRTPQGAVGKIAGMGELLRFSFSQLHLQNW
jgi:hypothetical protein